MKRVLIIALQFIFGFCFAQNLNPKNEIGINFYGIEVSKYTSQNPLHLFFNGIQYKHWLNNKYCFRTSFQYASKLENFDTDDGLNSFWIKGNSELKIYDARLGFEKTIGRSSKLKPFIFADAMCRMQSYSEKGIGYGDFPPYNSTINNQSTNNILGLSTGAGLTWYINSKLFLNLETSIGLNRNFTSSTYEVKINPIKTISFGVRF
jgi:hypothetical protein